MWVTNAKKSDFRKFFYLQLDVVAYQPNDETKSKKNDCHKLRNCLYEFGPKCVNS